MYVYRAAYQGHWHCYRCCQFWVSADGFAGKRKQCGPGQVVPVFGHEICQGIFGFCGFDFFFENFVSSHFERFASSFFEDFLKLFHCFFRADICASLLLVCLHFLFSFFSLRLRSWCPRKFWYVLRSWVPLGVIW